MAVGSSYVAGLSGRNVRAADSLVILAATQSLSSSNQPTISQIFHDSPPKIPIVRFALLLSFISQRRESRLEPSSRHVLQEVFGLYPFGDGHSIEAP
jgi:hypothetical protein